MKPIDNWRESWRFLSVQLASLWALVAVLEQHLPALEGVLPPAWHAWAAGAVVVARLIRQSVPLEPDG